LPQQCFPAFCLQTLHIGGPHSSACSLQSETYLTTSGDSGNLGDRRQAAHRIQIFREKRGSVPSTRWQ